jgi:outer membrane protein assembly factor BamB
MLRWVPIVAWHLLGDRIFFNTDNAHMLCLNRLTGALMWDVSMIDEPQHYGATGAPLVINGLIISGVAGGDEGIRGFIGAWRVTTGELVSRFYTVDKPDAGGSTCSPAPMTRKQVYWLALVPGIDGHAATAALFGVWTGAAIAACPSGP